MGGDSLGPGNREIAELKRTSCSAPAYAASQLGELLASLPKPGQRMAVETR